MHDAGVVCRNVFRWTENEGLADLTQWLVRYPVQFLVIFLAAFLLNRVARRTIRHFLTGLTSDASIATTQRIRRLTPRVLQATTSQPALRAGARVRTIGLVLRSCTTVLIYLVATFTALGRVGINLAPLIAGAGVVGVALGFGAQSLVKDFLSGIFMLVEDQYGVGDHVDVGDAVGTVEAVTLRTTRIRSVDGTVWHVPNGEIRRVGNMSQQWGRAVVDVDVVHDADLDQAMAAMQSAADAVRADEAFASRFLEDPEVQGVQAIGVDGISIRLVAKTLPNEQWEVSRELRRRIKEHLEAAGVDVPRPQRMTWMRTDAAPDAAGAAADEAGAP